MGFKITKQEQKERGEIAAKIDKLKAEVERAQETLNMRLSDLNAALVEGNEFRTRVVERLQEEFDDKSESWQAGDVASNVSDFIERWEDNEYEEVDMSDLDLPNSDRLTELDDEP